jgi:hypothetical protein
MNYVNCFNPFFENLGRGRRDPVNFRAQRIDKGAATELNHARSP